MLTLEINNASIRLNACLLPLSLPLPSKKKMPIAESPEPYFVGQKGFRRCDLVKNVVMGRLSGIIQMDPV